MGNPIHSNYDIQKKDYNQKQNPNDITPSSKTLTDSKTPTNPSSNIPTPKDPTPLNSSKEINGLTLPPNPHSKSPEKRDAPKEEPKGPQLPAALQPKASQ
jgi:hypothetical protein